MTDHTVHPGPETRPSAAPVPTAVLNARKQALARAAETAALAAVNSRIVGRRAADDQDPDITDSHAVEALAEHDKHHSALAAMATAHGTTPEQALADIAEQRKETVTQHLEQWRANRAVHQDLLDHPEVYGHCDLGGRPLKASEQQGHIRQYDAAIAEAEAELKTL